MIRQKGTEMQPRRRRPHRRNQSTLLAAMYRLIALMLAILAAAVSAYNAPVTAGRPAIQPRMTTVSPVAFAEEFDIGLDNPSIPEDKDAAPARKWFARSDSNLH